MHIWKAHAYGNDFLYVRAAEIGAAQSPAELARALLGDERVQSRSDEQVAMIERIGTTLGSRRAKSAPAGKRASPPAARKVVAKRRPRK